MSLASRFRRVRAPSGVTKRLVSVFVPSDCRAPVTCGDLTGRQVRRSDWRLPGSWIRGTPIDDRDREHHDAPRRRLRAAVSCPMTVKLSFVPGMLWLRSAETRGRSADGLVPNA